MLSQRDYETASLQEVRALLRRHEAFESSVPGILQAGILEWVAISFSRRSSQPRDRTQVSRIAGRHFNL